MFLKHQACILSVLIIFRHEKIFLFEINVFKKKDKKKCFNKSTSGQQMEIYMWQH